MKKSKKLLRDDQYLFSTWHGTPIKKMGKILNIFPAQISYLLN